MEFSRLLIAAMACLQLSYLCDCQGDINGSYLYLPVGANNGTVVGNATQTKPSETSSAFSIEGVTYYIDDISTPLTVQDINWRRPTTVSPESNDCRQSEGYVFPRNLFCIQYSTGSVMTTSQFESRRPRGASSFVLEIYIDVGGEPGRTPSSKTVIRIVPDCLSSVSNYTEAVKTCNRIFTNAASARQEVNGTYSYLAPTQGNNEIVALTIYLGRLKDTSLQVGNQLKFKIKTFGESTEEVSFNRTLLVSTVHENVTMYHLSSPVLLRLVSTFNLELRNGEDQLLSGATDAITFNIIERINYCIEENCLVPFGNWVKSAPNVRNPECLVIADNFFAIPKYNSCLANDPPVAGPHPGIILRIPNPAGLVLRILNVTDPEGTSLTYSIVSASFSTVGASSAVACNPSSTQPLCNYFAVNATGALQVQASLPGSPGNSYRVTIQVSDAGSPVRSVTIFQDVTLQDRCETVPILFQSLYSVSCLPEVSSIPALAPNINVTVLKYRYSSAIYKIINSSLSAGELVGFQPSEVDVLTLQVSIYDVATPRNLLRTKNVTQVLSPRVVEYDINLDIRVDRGQDIEIVIYGNKNGSSPSVLRANAAAIKIYPYPYELYCNNVNCVNTFRDWVKAITDLTQRGINGCDFDPRFTMSLYGNCSDPPNITVQPSPQLTLPFGVTGTMSCDFFSFSTAQVMWLKDGAPFLTLQGIDPTTGGEGSGADPTAGPRPITTKSFIVFPSFEYQGEFQCLVSNLYSNSTSETGKVTLQGTLPNSYFQVAKRVNMSFIVGTARAQFGQAIANVTSIDSATYFESSNALPRAVQDPKWRALPSVVVNSSDCEASKDYLFPRNLVCIQHTAGDILTTSRYEMIRPRGGSSLLLGIHALIMGSAINIKPSNVVVRVLPDCEASMARYASIIGSCNTQVTAVTDATQEVNGTYRFSSQSYTGSQLVAITLYLGRLRNTNLVAGNQLHFKINTAGEVPLEERFSRYLLANADQENITVFRLSSPLRLQFIGSIVVELRNQNNELLSGATNAMTLHIIDTRAYCDEEICLVPFGDWMKLPANIENPECPMLSDTSFLIPKYNSCLANEAPIAGLHPEIKLQIPNQSGQRLLAVDVADPENTTLRYNIMSVKFTSAEAVSFATCSPLSESPRCTYFLINSTGVLTAASPVPGASGDSYVLTIKATDSGVPPRSVTFNQSILLEDRCGNASILYRSFVLSSCLPNEPIIAPQSPNTNVTALVYQYPGSIYKVINGSLDIAGLVDALSAEVQQLILELKVFDGAQTRSFVRGKNVTQVLIKGTTQYDINLDLRVDNGQIIEARIYAIKDGLPPQLLRTNAAAIKMFAYFYQQYCDNSVCVKNFQDWFNALADVKMRGIQECDSDPRFVAAHYQHCLEQPRILVHPPKEIAVLQNAAVRISCGYFSFSRSSGMWFKDGVPFTAINTESPARRKRREGESLQVTSSIIFVSATLENQGEYHCLVQNQYGNATSNNGLLRLTDVVTSQFKLLITDRIYNNDYANRSSDAFKAISDELTRTIQNKFGSGRTGAENSVVVINSIKPGSVIADATVYSTGLSESSRRSQACASLIKAIDQRDFGTVAVDMQRSELVVNDCCNVSDVGFVEDKGRIKWPVADSNSAISVQCPYGRNGTLQNATRQCIYRYRGQASWNEPNTTMCSYLSQTTGDLEVLAQTTVNSGNVGEVAQRLVGLTSRNLISRLDILFSATTIENILNVLDSSPKIATAVIESASNLLISSQEVISKGQLYFNTSSRILKAIQKAADIVELEPAKPFFTRNFQNLALFLAEPPPVFKEDLTVVAALNATSGDTSIFSEQFEKIPNSIDQTVGSLFLPRKVLLESKQRTQKLRVSSLFFKNAKLFASNVSVREDAGGLGRTSTTKTNSFILDLTIRDLTLEGLTDKVVSRFKPLDMDAKGSLSCVFWDFLGGGGNGAWSSRGCSNVVYEKGFYRCQCDHLTHFGVLLDLSGTSLSKADEKALSIISYIGCAISLVGLALTILTFVVFKNLRKKLPPRILICLSASLAAVLIIFVAGIEKTSPRAGCQVVAIGLHYFLLTTFFWMAIEAYNLYRCFVIVIGSHMSMFLRKMSLAAWGIPLVIVAISAGVGIDDYGNDKHCMVTGLPFYIALVTPLAILLITNLIVFFFVLRGLSRNNVAKDKEISTLSKARIGLACSVLLGLTWILGFLAVEELSLPFQYLFCILNSLQGFFIFVFYCLRNNDVRREWRNLCCGRAAKDQSSSNAGKYATSKDKKGSSAGLFSTSDKRTSIPTDSSYVVMKSISPIASSIKEENESTVLENKSTVDTSNGLSTFGGNQFRDPSFTPEHSTNDDFTKDYEVISREMHFS